MPRPGQVKSSGVGRFSDRIALGVLTRAFPPELVDEVVAECGRVEQRTRLLPARVVVYFVLAMCLRPPSSRRSPPTARTGCCGPHGS
ncbi:transposase domain-containing protein, partial [Streptomyces flaveolus]|uniref:transposase domain-containing protein n=1 Tax=Streptomyces flaveolus TaxID=67297 RepID=UPI0033A21615